MKYWEWWYKNNKKTLETIGTVLLAIGAIILVGLLIYGMVLFFEYFESLPPGRPLTFLEIIIEVILWIIVFIFGFGLFLYRKYKKEINADKR